MFFSCKKLNYMIKIGAKIIMNKVINKIEEVNDENIKLRRNIKLDYVYCFMKNFDISSAIWVLYMVYRGLPLWQIGIVEGIFHITSFLFEVPSGAIADLFGRKNVMIAGRIFSALSAIVNLFSTNMFGFTIGFIISALGYNLNSGSEEALVYDSMKQCRCEDNYIKVNSKLNMIIEVSQGISTFAGGVLAEYSYVYCYIAVIIISLLSIIPCIIMKEPEVKMQNLKEKISLKKHFNICLEIIKGNREILKILIYYPVVFTFEAVVFFYGQQYFSVLGLNKIQISLVMLFSGILSCLGALTCEKVISIFNDKTKYAASFLMGISIIIISFGNLIASIIFFGVMNYANSILYPIQSTSLNKLIPSAQRATIISIDSMIFSISMVCLFPLSGFIADMFNLRIAFLSLGIVQILFISLLINKKRINKNK